MPRADHPSVRMQEYSTLWLWSWNHCLASAAGRLQGARHVRPAHPTDLDSERSFCEEMHMTQQLCILQIAVTDAEVRRGMLLLRPCNVVVLSGQASHVQDLFSMMRRLAAH